VPRFYDKVELAGSRGGDPTFSVDCKIGRLVEARPFALRVVEDAARFEGAERDVVSRLAREPVLCADWRAADTFPPDVADRLLATLGRPKPRFERLGVLISRARAPFSLQVEETLRAAADPSRRSFRDAAELKAWLSGALDLAERNRMHDFLIEPVPRTSSSMRMRVVPPPK
jgi:hypothetical protein